MPSLCFCCLSHHEKVQIVFSNFGALQRLSQLERDSPLPQFLCGRILPVTEVLQGPVSGKPCVYYEVIAEQLVDKTDENGLIGVPDATDSHKVWVPLCSEVQSADFTLVDLECTEVSLYVPGKTASIKVLATEDARVQSVGARMRAKCVVTHEQLPQYTKEFLLRQGVDIEDIQRRKVRYREATFEYGEQIAILGAVRVVQDLQGQPVTLVHTVGRDLLTKEYLDAKGWDDWDRKAWMELTSTPCIILTDMEKFFQNVKLQSLPVKPTYAQIVQVMAEREPQETGDVATTTMER